MSATAYRLNYECVYGESNPDAIWVSRQVRRTSATPLGYTSRLHLSATPLGCISRHLESRQPCPGPVHDVSETRP